MNKLKSFLKSNYKSLLIFNIELLSLLLIIGNLVAINLGDSYFQIIKNLCSIAMAIVLLYIIDKSKNA